MGAAYVRPKIGLAFEVLSANGNLFEMREISSAAQI